MFFTIIYKNNVKFIVFCKTIAGGSPSPATYFPRASLGRWGQRPSKDVYLYARHGASLICAFCALK